MINAKIGDPLLWISPPAHGTINSSERPTTHGVCSPGTVTAATDEVIEIVVNKGETRHRVHFYRMDGRALSLDGSFVVDPGGSWRASGTATAEASSPEGQDLLTRVINALVAAAPSTEGCSSTDVERAFLVGQLALAQIAEAPDGPTRTGWARAMSAAIALLTAAGNADLAKELHKAREYFLSANTQALQSLVGISADSTYEIRQEVCTARRSWLEVVATTPTERAAMQEYGRFVREHPTAYFECVRKTTSEQTIAFTPKLPIVTTFDALAIGDRFTDDHSLWTKATLTTARKHSEHSRSLGDHGYGYNGDAVCSFEATARAIFVPVTQAS